MNEGGSDSEAETNAESLLVLQQLQEIHCKDELYSKLEHLLGRPESYEESEGYYDDVSRLVELYREKSREFERRLLDEMDKDNGSTHEERVQKAQQWMCSVGQRSEHQRFVVHALQAAVNGESIDDAATTATQAGDTNYPNDRAHSSMHSSNTRDSSGTATVHWNESNSSHAHAHASDSNSNRNEHSMGNDEDEPAMTRDQIAELYAILEAVLTPRYLQVALAAGALLVAEEARRTAAETLQQTQEAHRRQQQSAESDSISTAAHVRRAQMTVSPEEMFRMAQLVRSGLADEAELLQLRPESDAADDVELNEEEPTFLRRVGLPFLRRRINYRALLPSQQLREARTPQQRQQILDRQAQRLQRQRGPLNSMERIAEMQLKINADRRMIARSMQSREARDEEALWGDSAMSPEKAQHQTSFAASLIYNKNNSTTTTTTTTTNDNNNSNKNNSNSNNKNNNNNDDDDDDDDNSDYKKGSGSDRNASNRAEIDYDRAAERQGSLLHTELDENPEEGGGFGRFDHRRPLPPWLRHSIDESDSASALHSHRRRTRKSDSRTLPSSRKGGSGGGALRFGLPAVSQSIHEQRHSLPIYAQRERILAHVAQHRVTILVGETGSGKTTQIPQYLIEAGYGSSSSPSLGGGVVCCTQPRRVAAETLAMRVADECGCRLGEEVGYTVRFRDVTSSLTRIKYVTDGMLLREALLDDSFRRYSVIMLDEAHERSMNTDLLFAIVRQALSKHPSLKVLVTSATLETEKFCRYFGVEEPLIIEGRTFPVATYYLREPTTDYVRAALQTVMKIHLEEPPGDVLVFLTGQEEIDLGGEQLFAWMSALHKQLSTGASSDSTNGNMFGTTETHNNNSMNTNSSHGKNKPIPLPAWWVLPLTATMPQEVQSRVFDTTPPGCRKIILATNVAETSITIDNLYYVVDCGYSKQSVFDALSGVESLRVAPISQAQAKQRAGRAGRIGPGKCFRLYTELQYKDDMSPSTVPDVMRANLFHVTLQLKAMGIDLYQLDLMDKPSVESMVAALEKLRYLEALDDDGLLTPLGGRMAQLSLDPSQSKTLLTAVDWGCCEPVLTIVSMLAVQKRGVFYRPHDQAEAAEAARRQFAQPEGDQITLMAVYDAWVEQEMSETWCRANFLKYRMLVEARDTRQQLTEMLQRRYKNYSTGATTNYTGHTLGNAHSNDSVVGRAGSRSAISHAQDDNLTLVRRALTAGYFFHAARRVDSHARSYVVLADRREVYVHPSSVLIDDPPRYVLYDDLRLTSREYMTELLAIEPRWLAELAPAFYTQPSTAGCGREGGGGEGRRRLTRAQEAERFTPILRAWETGSSWRISKQRKQRR